MSLQYSIDDVALNYNAELPLTVPVPTPVLVGNTRQCITGIGGTKCIAAGAYTALAEPADVVSIGNSLNARALSGLKAGDQVQANLPQAGSNNSTSGSITGGGGGGGVVTPSPYVKVISGVIGKITLVTVTIRSMSYGPVNFRDGYLEIDAPTGQKVPLLSGFGFVGPFTNQTFQFADSASTTLDNANPPISGVYKPFGFPPLAVFNGNSPNGTWTLVWQNSGIGNSGTIALGWDISITVDV